MSKCKSCGAEIIWIKMKSGKAAPCNPQKIAYRNTLPATGGGMTLVTPDGRIARGSMTRPPTFLAMNHILQRARQRPRIERGARNEHQ